MSCSRNFSCHQYLVVLGCFFIAYFTLGTALANAAIYYNYWLDEFEEQKSLTSLIGAINVGLILTLGPLASMLANRFNHRVIVCAGAVLSSAGMFAAAFSTSILGLLITHAICGVGWCLANVPGVMAASFYWKEKYYGAIFGIIISGIGVCQFVNPLLVDTLKEEYTWRGALIIQAGLNLNLLVCGALLTPMPGMRKESNFLQPELLKDVYFVNTLVYWIFGHMGVSVTSVHIGYVVKMALDVDNRQSAIVVAIFGASGAFARVGHGFLAGIPRVNTLLQQMVSLVIMATCLISMPFIHDYALMVVAAVFTGVGVGSMSLNTILTIDIVGMKSRTAGFGFFATSAGLGLASGAPIAGLLSDLTNGNYAISLYFGGGVLLLAVLLEVFPMVRWTHVVGRHLERIQVPVEDTTIEAEELL